MFKCPAIGAIKVILPRSVEDVVFGRPTPGALEHRLMCPFPLIPVVAIAIVIARTISMATAIDYMHIHIYIYIYK